MGLGFNNLADMSRPDTVLGRQLHLVPSTAFEVVQFEGALAGVDEDVLPFLTVIY